MSWQGFLNPFRTARSPGRKPEVRKIPLAVELLENRWLLSIYAVGPGLAYTSVNAVPWESLAPGDTVQIHWQAAAYHEKILISTSGTAQQPIRVLGVPGPAGQLPVIDGQNATTRAQASYPFAGTQDRGLVTITRDNQNPYGFKPSFIDIEGLDLRDANKLYNFTDASGATHTYTANAASIFVERGEHIVVRNCTITGSGNGLFVASGDDEATISRDILVTGNNIFGNGNAGSDREHNVYTAAAGCVFEYNHLGDLRPGALGIGIKDRSAGTVIRDNWIEGGARLLDLVDPEDSPDLMPLQPNFHDTYVYGNVFVNGPGDAGTLIHYGGDSGVTSDYRKGTLHFYNNTVVVQVDQTQQYNTTLLQPDTNDEAVELYNNILYTQSATPGAAPSQFNLVLSFGTITTGTNWVSPGWQISSTFGGFQGTITGTAKIIPAAGSPNNPGFVNLAANNFHLVNTSAAIDKGQSLDATAAAAGQTVDRQYVVPQLSEMRVVAGAALDLGAYELSATGSAGPVLYVDAHNTTAGANGSATKPFPTIQAAVNAATAGTTIDVAMGSYVENVVIPDVSLSLLGGFVGGTSAGYAAGQPGNFSSSVPSTNVTHITAASATAPVVFLNNVTAKTNHIEGFTLTGGIHGIYVVGDFQQFSNVTIAHNIIENNGPAALQPGGGTFDFFGGGIYSSNATVTISDNVIRNNNANRGGGMFIDSKSDYTIAGNLIDKNTGWDDHGGGIVLNPLPLSAAGTGTFAHNTISNNVAAKAYTYGYGGGILMAGNLDPASLKPVTLADDTWVGNFAPTVGGGIFADNGATVVLDHELVYKNSTQTYGGAAIYVDGDGGGAGSFMTIVNCTIADNTNAGQNQGNGVYVEEQSHVTIKNSILWGNTQELFVVPDNTGSTITVSYSDTQQAVAGTGNRSQDPLFANPAAGDFHEKSRGGRWDPAAQGGAGAFVMDAVNSPAIDAGDPAAAYSLETAPNGGRINMGVYGNTLQASRSGNGPADIGVYRPGTSTFYLDRNGNGTYQGPPTDANFQFGAKNDVPLVGDWNGDGKSEIGVYRPSTSTFYLDLNGNGKYDTGIDAKYPFGAQGDMPIVGDWNGAGKSEIGVYRPSTSTFYLDLNGNGKYETGIDAKDQFGAKGDVPLLGDWNGNGRTKIGVYRPSISTFYLDVNGNGKYDAGIDAKDQFGAKGDMPIVGDWNGDGRTKIGVYRSSTSTFYLDVNGNGRYDTGIDATDQFGAKGDVFLLGDWNGDGRTKIGVWRASSATFYLDVNGNGQYDGASIDARDMFGASTDTPLVGYWRS